MKMFNRPLMLVVLIILLIVAVWFFWASISAGAAEFWRGIMAEFLSLANAFWVPTVLTILFLLLFFFLCYMRVIWPPRPPLSKEGLDSFARWGAQCEAAGARATAIALFVGVVGGAIAWASLRASLLSYETVPDQVRAEGGVSLCVADTRQSSILIRLRAFGSGRARITGLGVYLKVTDEKEEELFSYPISRVLEIGGDDLKPLQEDNFQKVFRPKLHDKLKEKQMEAKDIEVISVEPRYSDMLKRPRTPEGKRYKLEIKLENQCGLS